MEIAKDVKVLGKAQRNAALSAMETAGFPALRSGLGLPAGKYLMTTENSENIYAVKPITTAKGKFGLTLVACTIKGAEAHNQSLSNKYGFGTTDKQCVVTADQFNAIEPNQAYNVTINDKGRIAEIVSASEETLNVAPAAEPAFSL